MKDRPLDGGKKAMREFASPASLIESHKWIPPDEPDTWDNQQEYQP